MRTSNPVSCITWNTTEFLKEKLNELLNKNVIEYWCFMKHHAEEDEKKDHIHLMMVPAKLIDTDKLKEELTEIPFDSQGEGKPIRPAQFRKLTFHNYGDWYLYVKHDTNYLLSKFQKRQYSYSDSDFEFSDETEFLEFKHGIDFSKYNGNKIDEIIQAIRMDRSFADLVASGVVPLQQFNQYERAYELMKEKEFVYRNGRLNTHE